MASKAESDLLNLLKVLGSLELQLNELKSAVNINPADFERINTLEQARNKVLEMRLSLLSRINAAQKAAVPGGSPNQSSGSPLPSMFPPDKKDDKGESAAAKLAREQREAAQKLASSNIRYREAIEQAEKLGLRIQDLRKIEDRGGGIQQLQFSRNMGGKQVNYRTYVDEMGKATPGLSSQFRTFGSDIVRDIGQFTKWSIAVAAVYTPLQKLGELMQIMVENETRLADATIAANVEFEDSGRIFDTSAQAADRAGESIGGVIDAYSQALRAAGRYTDESQRAAMASQLLNDALILSKLSGLDQAEAIDTLSAALLQTGMELDKGQELLNKWVRITQVANVNLDALSVGVAVLGDTAEASGLSIDKLNALIAVISEQSIKGGKEAANTAKALIGSYQSDTAEKALSRYGIALRKTNGEVRGFLEIYQEVASLQSQGLVSESGISELALALGGGGSRRTADAAALISTLASETGRYNQILEAQAGITGDSTLAQDSLEKKLQTVQTAATRLGNAWQSMAETLGDDGGLLDLLKSILNSLTGVVNATDSLFALMGRSGPILATFTTALVALRSIPDTRIAAMLGTMGPNAIGNWGASPRNDIAGIRQQGIGGFGKGILGDILQMNLRGAGIVGGLGVGISAASNLQAGKEENAIANVVGGAIGAAIGFTLGGPPGLAAGALIGSSAADSFVTGLTTHEQDLALYFAGLVQPTKDGAPQIPLDREKTTEEIINEAYKEIGGAGGEMFGEIRAYLAYSASKVIDPKSKTIAEDQTGSFATKEAAAIALLKEINPDLYKQLKERQAVEIRTQQPPVTSPRYAELQQLAEQERRKQLENVSKGELRPSEFGQISDRLTGFPTTAIRQMDTFGETFIKLSKDIDNSAEAYQAFLFLTVNGTEDQQKQINSYVSDIEKMQEKWNNWTPTDKILELSTGTKSFDTRDDLAKAIEESQRQASQFALSGITNAQLQTLKLPGIVGSTTEGTPAQEVDLIRQEAEKIQNKFYADMNLTIDQIDFLRRGLEDFTVLVERAGRNHFDTISGIDQKFWDAAQKLLVEQGKLAKKDGFGFQQFDVDRGTLESLAQRSVSIGNTWAKKFPGFETKQEDLLAITNEGIAKPIHADFRILALLLEKIVDQNQKQLDGQYNIPEGATFWVPLTAAYYRRSPDEGGDLQSMLDSLAVDENTGATNANTNAIWNLSETFGQYYASEKNMVPYDENAKGKAIYQASERTYVPYDKHENRFDKMNPIAGPQEDGKSMTVLQTLQRDLLNLLRNLFTPRDITGAGRYAPKDPTNISGSGGSVGGRQMLPQQIPQSSSRLDLRFQSNINLMVDGRAIANVVRTYLASELLKADSSQGTITKRFVI